MLTGAKEEDDEDDDVEVDVTEEEDERVEVGGVGDVGPSVVADAGMALVLVGEVVTVVDVAGVVAGEQIRICASRATRSTSS